MRDRKIIDEPPIIKGSKLAKKKIKSNAYLLFEERKILLGILMRRGMDFEEARGRLDKLVKEQIRIREKMKAKNKSEEEIKEKQEQLLEELWEY